MVRPLVAVLDYGSGNLRSVVRAVERAGADVVLTADSTVAEEAAGLVVPGVGAFEACMTGLRSVGGERIIDRRLVAGRPVLGICVGMQILFAEGIEHGVQSDGAAQWPPPWSQRTAKPPRSARSEVRRSLVSANTTPTTSRTGEPWAAMTAGIGVPASGACVRRTPPEFGIAPAR